MATKSCEFTLLKKRALILNYICETVLMYECYCDIKTSCSSNEIHIFYLSLLLTIFQEDLWRPRVETKILHLCSMNFYHLYLSISFFALF